MPKARPEFRRGLSRVRSPAVGRSAAGVSGNSPEVPSVNEGGQSAAGQVPKPPRPGAVRGRGVGAGRETGANRRSLSAFQCEIFLLCFSNPDRADRPQGHFAARSGSRVCIWPTQPGDQADHARSGARAPNVGQHSEMNDESGALARSFPTFRTLPAGKPPRNDREMNGWLRVGHRFSRSHGLHDRPLGSRWSNGPNPRRN